VASHRLFPLPREVAGWAGWLGGAHLCWRNMNVESILQDVSESVYLHGFARLPPSPDALGMFNALSSALCREFVPSIGRKMLQESDAGTAQASTHYTPSGNFTLLGHSERAYRPCRSMPDYCFFLCMEAPASEHYGGSTTLVDGQQMIAELPPELLARLCHEGVIYSMEWGPDRWQQEFGVSCRDELERLLEAASDVSFRLREESLSLRWQTSPFLRSWSNGKEAFANGILAHLPSIPHQELAAQHTYCNPTNKVFWGSGELMNDASVCQLINAHERCVIAPPWRKGEILILDNLRIMHGRRLLHFSSTRRIIGRFGLRRHPSLRSGSGVIAGEGLS
jgi:hypothetical protein